ncbi:MAG TPA: sulfatase-like hydrolase/transferase [bacterium]|nr:sulfatase-like hydrolase/transferase [bacterium]
MMRSFSILAICAALLCCGCARKEKTTSSSNASAGGMVARPTSLLLVTLDTFRGDFWGAAGDPVTRTPHLDRIARRGMQFKDGLSSCPLTLPSHATMHTGLEPPEHGIRDNGIYRLREDVPTLATRLSERGFRTAAFISGFPLVARFGLTRGFEVYDDHLGGSGQNPFIVAYRSGSEVDANAEHWIDSLPGDARWFGWTHFFDAHEPCEASQALIHASGNDTYRADIALADRYVGRLVHHVQAMAKPPWIVIVGDHGESRGAYGETTHGIFVYDVTLRVPAILWPAPGGHASGLSNSTLRTVDVASTIFDLLAIQDGAPGKGTSALVDTPRASYFESHFAHLHFGWAPLRGVREGKWKFIDAPEPELFNLEADSGEKMNVASANPGVVRDLQDKARTMITTDSEAPRVDLDAESKQALESLGYTASLKEPEESESLPDPKRMMAILPLLDRAHGLLAAGRWQEALGPLRAAVARDPGNKEIHQMLGTTFARLGRHPEAIDSYLKCLDLPPHENDRIYRFELAVSYMEMGRMEEAIPHLEKILDEDPKDPVTWYNLGVARDRRGNTAGARRAWEMALKADSTYVLARQALGQVPRQ